MRATLEDGPHRHDVVGWGAGQAHWDRCRPDNLQAAAAQCRARRLGAS